MKAFSDAPIALTQGIFRAEKLLRTLFVKDLHLWPRFRDHVVRTLDACRVRQSGARTRDSVAVCLRWRHKHLYEYSISKCVCSPK